MKNIFHRILHYTIIAAHCFAFQQTNAKLSLYEQQMLTYIPGYSLITDHIIHFIETSSASDYLDTIVHSDVPNPLFRQYPQLQHTISYISLGCLPTPIYCCTTLNKQFPSFSLFIKNDGITGSLNENGTHTFGGNKLRKLQYLLADAKAHGHDTVMTFGCTGSNHAVQTAVCAQQLGLDCICMLTPQPNSRIVQRNLLLHHAYHSTLFFSQNSTDRAHTTVDVCSDYKKNNLNLPYIIPTGGSNARGALGYVEAAFELKEQIDAGIMPHPDHIYVTLGSGGTAAGLLLGAQAANIDTQWHLILIQSENKDNAYKKLEKLFYEINDLLISADVTFPQCTFPKDSICIENTYSGTRYGLFTPECVQAMHILKTTENIQLDGVYTGKCMSALLADAQSGKLDNSTVLFWNTFCAEDMAAITEHIDYHLLPNDFHTYFENMVQPLEQ